MKINKLKLFFATFIIVGLLFNSKSYAQEFNVDDYKIFYNFKTVKLEDNTRLLEVSYIAQNSEDKTIELPIYGAEIAFLNILGEQEVLLGTVKTAKDGIAKMILPADFIYLSDDDGLINITAKFPGSDVLSEEIGEVIFKDINLELNVEVIDSVKTVSVNAYTINSLGEEVPVEETDIVFYVGSMLSKLKVEEGTITAGTYEFEFTTEIPGDDKGNLNIFAMIEDNEQFANVIQMKTGKFGTILEKNKVESNTLWSEAAPIWMYVVLTILLVGVWVNFIYTIIQLIKIKIDSPYYKS